MKSTIHKYFIDNNIEAPYIMAGPCSAESFDRVLKTAQGLKAHGVKIFRAGVWKPRTRPGGFEGYGEIALNWLQSVKEETGMLTATEIGNSRQAEAALKAGIDILWIGARTTASPFAVQEIADALRGCENPVMVKNPAAVDIDLWIGAFERLYLNGITNLAAILRGFKVPEKTCYRNAPLWDLVDSFRNALPAIPILCDPSHMGGSRDKIQPLSFTALSKGYSGLMIESHHGPDGAMTDSFQQITPAHLKTIIDKVLYSQLAPIILQ